MGTFIAGPSLPRLTVSATDLGCILDCNLDTGLTIAGAAPTDNYARLQGFLSTAVTLPLRLIIDGGTALSAPLVIPAGSNVTIAGVGKYSGFYMLSGANGPCITNKLGAPFEPIINGTVPAQSGSLHLENFRIEGNRAGNSTSGNLRGIITSYPSSWFTSSTNLYCNLDLCNLARLVVRDLISNNSPLYAARITNCSDVLVDNYNNLNTYGDSLTVFNGDGLHFSGPIDRLRVCNSTINTNSDDGIPLNCPEGYGGNITNVLIENCHIIGYSMMRLYCGTYTMNNIHLRNFTGSGYLCALLLGIQTGVTVATGGLTVAVDQIADFEAAGGSVTLPSTAKAFSILCNSFGGLRLKSLRWNSPPSAVPFVALANTGLNVSEFLVDDITVYRTTTGSAAAGALIDTAVNAGSGTANTLVVKRLTIRGYKIADEAGQSFSAIPYLLNIGSGSSIGELFIESLDPKNITALVSSANGWTNITSVAGAGVLACGFQIPDALMAVNTPYISATGANAGKMCIQHTAGTVVVIG